jgi:hypothetical protein
MPQFQIRPPQFSKRPPRASQFGPKRGRIRFDGFGAATTQQEVSAGSAIAGAGLAYGLSAAGTAVFPGIGTAVGAAIGLIADALIHTGQGPERAAQSAAISNALAGISTANHQGAAIPWIGTATNPGLQQFLQAIMTQGLFMSWDPNLISSPAVNGNWANTFIAAVKQVTQAIAANPVGKTVCLNITDRPGGNDAVGGQFCFVNPGLAAGPDVISQKVIMGNGGLMYWMVLRTGESPAHAALNANNNPAEKVFALMVDHAAYDLTPPPPPATIKTVANAPAPTPIAPVKVIPKPVSIIKAPATAPAKATILPVATKAAPVAVKSVTVTGTTTAGTPIVAVADTNALIQQLIAQGQTQSAAIEAAQLSLQAQGVNTGTPAVQAQLQAAAAPTGLFGLSDTALLLIAGGAVAIYFAMRG